MAVAEDILAAGASVACGPREGYITIAEYGDAWPFIVSAGTLQCDTDGSRKYVTLDTGKGIHYALNGSAKDFGFPDSVSILKPGMTGVHLDQFIQRGLTLCD